MALLHSITGNSEKVPVRPQPHCPSTLRGGAFFFYLIHNYPMNILQETAIWEIFLLYKKEEQKTPNCFLFFPYDFSY